MWNELYIETDVNCFMSIKNLLEETFVEFIVPRAVAGQSEGMLVKIVCKMKAAIDHFLP